MCTPSGQIGKLALDLTTNLTPNVVSYLANKENNEYRTQVAINNAKMAQNEALRQKQLGIEESRKEQIKGINKVNALLARNSASGLDANSLTNQYGYSDILKESEINSGLIKKEYDLAASEYFNKASSYFNEANINNSSYNQSLFNNAVNALGKTTKVATDWYVTSREEAKHDYI